MDFFWMKTIFGFFFLLFFSIFFILDAIVESKIIFRGFMVSRIQRRFFICLHHSQSQEMPFNAMAGAASATAGKIFSWGAPRRIGLWRPWPGEEKHLQLAQLQQDGGHPSGEVQAVLPPIHQPPAAGEAVHLSYVSFLDTNLLSVVWFGWQQLWLLRKFMVSQFTRSLDSPILPLSSHHWHWDTSKSLKMECHSKWNIAQK